MKLALIGLAYAWAIISVSMANGSELSEMEILTSQQTSARAVVPPPSPASPQGEQLDPILLSPRPVEMQDVIQKLKETMNVEPIIIPRKKVKTEVS